MKKDKEIQKRIFVVLITWIIIFSNVNIVKSIDATDIANVDVNIDKADPKDFEDVAVFIDSYEPPVVKTWFLEKKDYPVYISLSGISINPTLDITKIRNIRITPADASSRKLIGSITPIAPPNRRYTLSNLGGAIINLKRIPQEDKVPNRIDINLTAYIDVDVAEGFGAFETDFVLGQEDENTWFGSDKELSSFWGGSGYLRVNNIGENNAQIVVYDDVYRDVTRESLDSDPNIVSRKRSLTLSVGETSGIIPLRRDIFANSDNSINQRLSFRDKIRVRLDEIRNAGKSAELSIIIDGLPKIKKVYEGSQLYEGSTWTVKSIALQNTKEIVEITDGKNIKIVTRDHIISGNPAAQAVNLDQTTTTVDLGQQKVNELGNSLDAAITQNKIEDIKTIRDELIKLYEKYYGLPSGTIARQKLSQISTYYLSDGTKYEQELNVLYRDIAFIENQKALQKQTQVVSSNNMGSQDYYLRAIQDFETVADGYPSSPYPSKALFEAARTRVLMGDYDGAIAYYNRYLNDFSGEASVEANRNLVEFLILNLQNDKGYLHEDVNDLLDNAKKINIRISREGVNIEQDSSEATVSITDNTKVSNQVQKSTVTVIVGQGVFVDESSTALKWYVKQIDSDKIIIYRIIDNIKGPETKTIKLNQDSLVETQNGVRTLRVDSIKFSSIKKAHITVLPAEERFVSKSDFSAHFSIEKRLFELTPKQIDAHIKTTKQLISKFDSAIDSLDKVHKVWTGWCYGVFATLWVKNLITSFGGRGLARKVVMERWNKICNQEIPVEGSTKLYQPQDSRLKRDAIFDECIRLNSNKIQDEINKANDAVSKTDEQIKQIKEDGDQRFSGLDIKKDENLIRETLLKENLARELKTQQYVDDYISSQIELQKAITISKYDLDKHPENLETVLNSMGVSLNDYNAKNPAEKQEILSMAIVAKVRYEQDQYILDLPKNLDKLSISDSVPSEVVSSSVNKFVSNTFSPGEIKGAGEKIVVYEGEIQKHEQEGKPPIRVLIIGGESKVLKKEIDANGKETGREYYVGGDGKPVYIETTKNLEIKVDDKKTVYKPIVHIEEFGKGQRLVKRITLDEIEYVDVERINSGAIEKVSLWKRLTPNSEPGSSTDIPEDVSITPNAFKSKGAKYSTALDHIRNLDAQISSGKKLDTGFYASADAATKYIVGKQVAKTTGPRCSDFMDPNDCLFLFGACDPIMCPTSRFNRGGNYYVNNVVASGIFGSIFLGADTLFDPAHGEVLPVCLTGITAGARNYRSILQGYVQCLEVKRDKGLSVGICDRIRNVGICSVVWREASAILNVDGGGLGILSNKLLDKGKGGGEYAFFKQGIKNSVDSAKFFTNQYASNVFAAYRGDTIGEVGGELCQAAIYGRIPGGGSIIERLSRPAGPAQFTAILDEVPRSTIARGDVATPKDSISDYQVYYHIYAGDQSDMVRYLVEVRGPGLPPRQLNVLRLLRAGEFVDQNEVFSSYSGYNEVCIQVNGNTQCGFGVVSTDYEISKLREDYVKNQAERIDITSEKQCVPEPGLISSASSPLSGALGVLSSGLTQTPIIRKCAGDNPGIKDNTQSYWVQVGTCGKDDIGRSLGNCYLDTRSTDNLLKDKQSQEELDNFLKQEKEKRIATGELLSADALNKLLDEAQNIRTKAKDDVTSLDSTIQSLNDDQIKALIASAEQKYKDAISKYDEVIQKGVLEANITAQAYFERGTTYQALGLLVSRPKEKPKQVAVEEMIPSCTKDTISTNSWVCQRFKEGDQRLLEGTSVFIKLNSMDRLNYIYTKAYTDFIATFDVAVGRKDNQKDCDNGILGQLFTGKSIKVSGNLDELKVKKYKCESKDLDLSLMILNPEFILDSNYKFTDGISFKVFYSPAGGVPLVYTGPVLGDIPTQDDIIRIKNTYGSYVERYISDEKLSIDSNIIYGIMWVESKGYHWYPPGTIKNGQDVSGQIEISTTGCKGIMQLCEESARPYMKIDPPNIDEREKLFYNILVGIKIFKGKYNYQSFVTQNDRVKFALLSYNLGEGVVGGAIKELGKDNPSFEEVIAILTPDILKKYGAIYRDEKYFPNDASLQRKIDIEAKPYVYKVLTAISYFRGATLASNTENTQNQENQNQVAPVYVYMLPPSAPPPSSLASEFN